VRDGDLQVDVRATDDRGRRAQADREHVVGRRRIRAVSTASVYAASKAAVSWFPESLHHNPVSEGTSLRASVFYPSGGLLRTGLFTAGAARGHGGGDVDQPAHLNASDLVAVQSLPVASQRATTCCATRWEPARPMRPMSLPAIRIRPARRLEQPP
jgi:hypothetical protein